MKTITINATPQVVFDKAVAQIRKQDYRRSITEDGACSYRGDNNTQCAFGPMLTDAEANECEGYNLQTLVNRGLISFDNIEAYDLARQLQLFHDASMKRLSGCEIEQGLRNIAEDFGLNYTTQEA